jgi:hypothetical protein
MPDNPYPGIAGPSKGSLAPHLEDEFRKTEGKTVREVEFGAEVREPQEAHEGEVLVLHFTDGTALAVRTGSNAKDIADRVEGLKEAGDFRADLIPQWSKDDGSWS